MSLRKAVVTEERNVIIGIQNHADSFHLADAMMVTSVFPQKSRNISNTLEAHIAITKFQSSFAQEDVFGYGDGIPFKPDSPSRQHPTTTIYERGGRF